ncbi:glycosyltransferase family 2 protein [Methylococcus mesophilus]|uniref:glycosyltransferase family 2 protein n=1 Tax=Methylococcus mesophilus TaxID=2993564 RepID=UPI00224B6AA1|nr:glycosyltransferase family 2 protein [Methylococcus mesophilus]UZR28004.1 glycosyltransferase family 2 protein [Methylococcus mesophilus]
MRLSVVVPVHNEIDNLESLIGEITQALTPLGDYEIVYVDDGSTDGTLEKLRALKASVAALRVLRHVRCCGQSTALRTGILAARGAWIATLDGDGQNDPADIPRLLDALDQLGGETGRGMVAGYRRKRKDTGWRRFSSRIANAVRGGLLRDNTPDTGCGLKVFSRALFLELPYFDHMHRFLPALTQRAGAPVVSVEVNHRPRLSGVSKYGTWHRLWVGIVDLFGVMWLQRRARVPQVEEQGA